MGTLLDKLTAGFSRLRVGAGAFLSGDITLQAGDNVSITPAGNVITIASDGGGSGTGLPAPYTAELDGANLVVSAPDIASSSQAPSITIRGVTNTGAEDPGGGDVVIEGGGATHGGGSDSGTAILRGGAGSGGQHGGTALVEGGASSDPLNGGYAMVQGSAQSVTDGVSGGVIVRTQETTGAGAAGGLQLEGGWSSGSGNAGGIYLEAGSATGTGQGGAVSLAAGATADGTGGAFSISAGDGGGMGGVGGDVRIATGDGTDKGVIRFGYRSAGLFTDSMALVPVANRLSFGGGATIEPRLWSQTGGIAATPWLLRQDLSASTLAAAIVATMSAFRWTYLFSDTTRTPFEIQYDRTVTAGRAVHKQAGTSLSRTETENFAVDTSFTTPTLAFSYALQTYECVTVTVTAQHDNGTTGRTAYVATFRQTTGSPGTYTTEMAAVDISPSSAGKKSHAMTIALNGNTIEVKVVAASATATKHRGSVTLEIGSIA